MQEQQVRFPVSLLDQVILTCTLFSLFLFKIEHSVVSLKINVNPVPKDRPPKANKRSRR